MDSLERAPTLGWLFLCVGGEQSDSQTLSGKWVAITKRKVSRFWTSNHTDSSVVDASRRYKKSWGSALPRTSNHTVLRTSGFLEMLEQRHVGLVGDVYVGHALRVGGRYHHADPSVGILQKKARVAVRIHLQELAFRS
jgi:hypothetical protein